ncbi:sigma-70 family RNA polymerase sigma factor [Falsibacillus albus]|uniref:Sigma-70 family RNA polymerase sigma factor n=1 Tax=Falsibacillus albus TaxID=2478915 RepID=A0A3L7JNL3_9BACI|nr:sigma-70 family RNA polymerase sigma factor [Falsibacillus albus]RLQ92417.1 sigma-70 family RNA polymerase sigma factor [Falsibacillus albus]
MSLVDKETSESDSLPNTKEALVEALIHQYQTHVLWFIYTYVKNKQTAEDLTQETFISCYRNIGNFGGDSSKLKSWLLRIAANKSKDYLRKNKLKNLLSLHSVEEIYSNERTTEELFFDDIRNNQIVEHVLKLPTKYREVIFLFHVKEFSLQEIREILNQNLNTIKTRLTRGRKILKHKLKEEGIMDV